MKEKLLFYKIGMDFAHSTNGYFYHTKYDAFDTIPLETLQHTGDNILSITKALADSSELENIEVIHFISSLSCQTDPPKNFCLYYVFGNIRSRLN